MHSQALTPVHYSLPLGHDLIPLNPFIGKTISLQFTGKIACLGCHQIIKKSYQDGYCFPCTQRLARCDFCILKPERCHFHLGTCREPQWGETHCMIPHVVYIANASGLKVGITRKTQIPTRWIDQGAISALPIIEVPTRRVSGFVEVALAKTISDKTNWRNMLKNEVEPIDLLVERQNILDQFSDEFANLKSQWGETSITILSSPTVCQFEYPVLEYPKKVNSLSFDKQPIINDILLGIKGQYLIFSNGVINIRKHSGYEVAFSG